MKSQSIIAAALMAVGAAGFSPAADFSWAPMENLPDLAEIVMVGDIVTGDADKLRHAIGSANELGYLVRSVLLYSLGGSLAEGLEIGRIIRANRIYSRGPTGGTAEYPEILMCSMVAGSFSPLSNSVENTNCSCFSACALAWLGGVGRNGDVGFHRAYLGSQDAEYDDYENTISGASVEVRTYLEEMRVPSFVFDRIMTTASTDIVTLSPEQRKVIRYDPVFSEFLIARCGGGPSDEDGALEAELFVKNYSNSLNSGRRSCLRDTKRGIPRPCKLFD